MLHRFVQHARPQELSVAAAGAPIRVVQEMPVSGDVAIAHRVDDEKHHEEVPNKPLLQVDHASRRRGRLGSNRHFICQLVWSHLVEPFHARGDGASVGRIRFLTLGAIFCLKAFCCIVWLCAIEAWVANDLFCGFCHHVNRQESLPTCRSCRLRHYSCSRVTWRTAERAKAYSLAATFDFRRTRFI